MILICKISDLQSWMKYQEEQLTPFFVLHRHGIYLQWIKKPYFRVLWQNICKALNSSSKKGQILTNFCIFFDDFIRKIIYFTFFLYGVIDQLCRSNHTEFQFIWPWRTSFMAIYWKYLKIQLNSWYADSLVCKIEILKKIQNY